MPSSTRVRSSPLASQSTFSARETLVTSGTLPSCITKLARQPAAKVLPVPGGPISTSPWPPSSICSQWRAYSRTMRKPRLSSRPSPNSCPGSRGRQSLCEGDPSTDLTWAAALRAASSRSASSTWHLHITGMIAVWPPQSTRTCFPSPHLPQRSSPSSPTKSPSSISQLTGIGSMAEDLPALTGHHLPRRRTPASRASHAAPRPLMGTCLIGLYLISLYLIASGSPTQAVPAQGEPALENPTQARRTLAARAWRRRARAQRPKPSRRRRRSR